MSDGLKVGDRVKVKADGGGHPHDSRAWRRRGQTGRVVELSWYGISHRCRWDSDAKVSWCYLDALEPLSEISEGHEFKVGDRVRWHGSPCLPPVRSTVEQWSFEFPQAGMCAGHVQWRDDSGTVWHCDPASLEPLTEVWRAMALRDDRLESTFAATVRIYEKGLESDQRCTAFGSERGAREWARGCGMPVQVWRCEAVVKGVGAYPEWPDGTVLCEHLMPVERVATYRDGQEVESEPPAPEPNCCEHCGAHFPTYPAALPVHTFDAEDGSGPVTICHPCYQHVPAGLVGANFDPQTGERRRRPDLRRAAPDAEQSAALAERLEQTNEALRDQLRLASASGRYVTEGFLAAGCGEDEDYHAFLRRLTAEIARLAGVENDLRGRLAATEKEVMHQQARANDLCARLTLSEAARAADARVVEAAVAMGRYWQKCGIPSAVSGDAVKALFAAVEGHPAYREAEPAPEPQKPCANCGNERGPFLAPFCQTCWILHNKLKRMREEAGE